MSSNLTRKELKQDNVALNVEKSVNFVTDHRQKFIQIAGGILALILIVAAVFYYRSSQQSVRQQMLGDAMALQTAPVGAPPPNGGQSFPSEAAKRSAVQSGFQKIISEHAGTSEGYIAEYSLAQLDVEAGKMDDARKKYQDVGDHADANYASLAKLALAQLDFADNKPSDAQNILKDLQDHPTDLVSKSQATYTLARGLMATQPEEARRLLMGLAATQNDVTQVAVAAMSDLPTK